MNADTDVRRGRAFSDAMGRALLFAVIGIELVVLLTWGRDSARAWFDPDAWGYGDFDVFYENARTLSLNNMYSPGLQVLMHPLTWLDMRDAFAVYFGVNVAALVIVALIAQAGARSMAGKAAVALAVLSLPQTHWALRVGHFTEVLALAALGGLLLAERRPALAGALIALLALKPQYLPVPLLYLLFTRNWRAFGVAAGGLGALAVTGVAAMALRDGPGAVTDTAAYYAARAPELVRYATVAQGDANYTQSWQYSWYGFLVSIGVERNPLVALALTALSMALVLAVWVRCSAPVAKVATALGMLLITPHTTFYNWSMLSVAFALLMHADLRPRYLVPLLGAGVGVAACATQAATPWPLPVDRFRPPGTEGVYWVQPAVLLALCVLAVNGRGEFEAARAPWMLRALAMGAARAPMRALAMVARGAGSAPTTAGRVSHASPRMPSLLKALGAIACGAAFVSGGVAAAYVSSVGPFGRDAIYSRGDVLAALPADFPAPDGAELHDAGPGQRLPYRIEWRSGARASEVAGAMRARLDSGAWSIVPGQGGGEDDSIDLRSARRDARGATIAELSITASEGGSSVRVEFSPLPAGSVPRYDAWLRSVGLVVHNVDPALSGD